MAGPALKLNTRLLMPPCYRSPLPSSSDFGDPSAVMPCRIFCDAAATGSGPAPVAIWRAKLIPLISIDATRAPIAGRLRAAPDGGSPSARRQAGHHDARGDRRADAGRGGEGGARRPV